MFHARPSATSRQKEGAALRLLTRQQRQRADHFGFARDQLTLPQCHTGYRLVRRQWFDGKLSVNALAAYLYIRAGEAGLAHCSAHGLRKASAAMLAESGASTQQLMAIFGWRTTKEPERYTRDADRKKMAAAGMAPVVKKGTQVSHFSRWWVSHRSHGSPE